FLSSWAARLLCPSARQPHRCATTRRLYRAGAPRGNCAAGTKRAKDRCPPPQRGLPHLPSGDGVRLRADRLVAEDPHAAVWLLPVAVRDEPRGARHLVLLAADVRRLG